MEAFVTRFKERLLILGAGQTGKKIIQYANTKFEVFATFYRNRPNAPDINLLQLDKMRSKQLSGLLEKVNPDVIIDVATLPGTDYMEAHKDETYLFNVVATEDITNWVRLRRPAPLFVFMSTDYVFDGSKGSYSENDVASPLNYYGSTKLEAERIISNSCERYIIVRPSLIYSWDPILFRHSAARNPSFAMWLIGELIHGRQVKVFNDQFSSPTIANNLAQATVELIVKKKKGIYHMAGKTRLSRYEFAKKIAEALSLRADLILPLKTSDAKLLARRPYDCSLNVTKATQELEVKPLEIYEAMTMFATEAIIDLPREGFERNAIN